MMMAAGQRRRQPRRVGTALLTAAIVATACSSSGSGSGTTTAPVTTTPGGADATEASTNPQADFSGLVAIGGGREMYMECRGRGSPTVVLVAGGGERGENWSATERPDQTGVFPEVATFSRVCAYDRPGTATKGPAGWDVAASTAVPQPITPASAAADLHDAPRGVR